METERLVACLPAHCCPSFYSFFILRVPALLNALFC